MNRIVETKIWGAQNSWQAARDATTREAAARHIKEIGETLGPYMGSNQVASRDEIQRLLDSKPQGRTDGL